jgi:hypothetical protein
MAGMSAIWVISGSENAIAAAAHAPMYICPSTPMFHRPMR